MSAGIGLLVCALVFVLLRRRARRTTSPRELTPAEKDALFANVRLAQARLRDVHERRRAESQAYTNIAAAHPRLTPAQIDALIVARDRQPAAR